MVSRYWAAQTRPTLFSHIILKSQEDVHSLASFIRSPLAVPAPLQSAIRTIVLYIHDSYGTSRPWMYHFWALLRDDTLLNLKSVDLKIGGNDAPPPGRSRCETLLDIGFPRTLPFARPMLHLRTLVLDQFQFQSYARVLKCLTYCCSEYLGCTRITWPEDRFFAPPARHLRPRSRQCSHTFPSEMGIISKRCTAIAPVKHIYPFSLTF